MSKEIPKPPPTSEELLNIVTSPNHSSQKIFEKTKNVKMLPTCVQNGYTYVGYPDGLTPPNYLNFRMEARLKEMEKEMRESNHSANDF